jgi:hypothetical protein
LRFYNNNKYKISYYQDNEKIEIDNDDSEAFKDNDGSGGDDIKGKPKKKLMFINDDE